jgi:1,4-dihydroxy-2-naphthoate octaprenyltransferase
MLRSRSGLPWKLFLGVRMLRAQICVTTLSSVALGAQIAWHDGHFHWGYYGLTMLGVAIAHIALNVDNDYRDYLSGADANNPSPTLYSGGSRILQAGDLSPSVFFIVAQGGFALCALIGFYLAYARGWPILALGLLAGVLIFFYSRLAYTGHGLGELTTFVASGPLLVGGAYYVQAQTFALDAWLCSLASGFGIANIVFINEFPDYVGDKASGKNTLVVVLGRRRAVTGFAVLLALTYAPIVVGVLSGAMPQAALLVLLTLPLAYASVQIARANYNNLPGLLPANFMTILLHVLNMLLVTGAYMID